MLPLAIPGIAAGSIFTFSLTLGDLIVPQLVGPPGYLLAIWFIPSRGRSAICRWRWHRPGAAIILIALYLAFVKRLVAFDAL
ncbi:hypothetical protein ACLB1N_08290 [Escherichia coli]